MLTRRDALKAIAALPLVAGGRIPVERCSDLRFIRTGAVGDYYLTEAAWLSSKDDWVCRTVSAEGASTGMAVTAKSRIPLSAGLLCHVCWTGKRWEVFAAECA